MLVLRDNQAGSTVTGGSLYAVHKGSRAKTSCKPSILSKSCSIAHIFPAWFSQCSYEPLKNLVNNFMWLKITAYHYCVGSLGNSMLVLQCLPLILHSSRQEDQTARDICTHVAHLFHLFLAASFVRYLRRLLSLQPMAKRSMLQTYRSSVGDGWMVYNRNYCLHAGGKPAKRTKLLSTCCCTPSTSLKQVTQGDLMPLLLRIYWNTVTHSASVVDFIWL